MGVSRQEFADVLKEQMESASLQLTEIPNIDLYIDQITNLFDTAYADRKRDEDEKTLTKTMVNNYSKEGILRAIKGKKYSREHLAYLTAVGILKHVLSTKDMDLLIREELQGRESVEDGYAAFCESLDRALVTTAEEIDKVPAEETIADRAFHFALLSYASGIACSRYISLLREQKGEAEVPAKPAKRKKEKEHKNNA